MFNIIDIIVILIILISVYFGYKKGFIKTVISLLSFFVAIALAVVFYKPIAVILTENTMIDDWIIENIISNDENEHMIEETNTSPDFAKNKDIEVIEDTTTIENGNISSESIFNMLENLPATFINNFDFEEVKEGTKREIAYKISELIMNLLSLILIYVVVKVTLFFATFILDGIMHLPILKQVNEVLGMAIGAVIGFIQIYISFAVITFISTISDISIVITTIKMSSFASILFENNLIINLLF